MGSTKIVGFEELNKEKSEQFVLTTTFDFLSKDNMRKGFADALQDALVKTFEWVDQNNICKVTAPRMYEEPSLIAPGKFIMKTMIFGERDKG